MERVITYSFCENYLERLAEFIYQEFISQGVPFDRLAIVFGGKRPRLFLQKELMKHVRRAFVSPHFFTIDEFIAYTVSKKIAFTHQQDLHQCYLLYNLAKETVPQILAGRESFSGFLPWVREILSFIDQLDLEHVRDDDLKGVEENAEIGYPVPEDINQMLNHLVVLRRAYHEYMREHQEYSRGFQYLRAAKIVEQEDFSEFEHILFCNFFYFNRSEEAVVRSLYCRKKAWLIFQGDERKWPVLSRISRSLGKPIKEGEQPDQPGFKLALYSAFDVHSQVGMVREILKGLKPWEKTVIVLPSPENIIPLLAEVAPLIKDFNISMGYPLRRSSLYSLLEFIFQSQLSKRDDCYYTREYLKALKHPLVKNLKLGADSAITRVLVHKVEEIITGQEMTGITGTIFLSLESIESEDAVFILAQETLRKMGHEISLPDLKILFEELHQTVFRNWEKIRNFEEFSLQMSGFLEDFHSKSSLRKYPLNTRIIDRIMAVSEELGTSPFRLEDFRFEEMVSVFDIKIKGEMVPFIGSPLKGLQILGLFETRSLNFDHVIVMDVNEGVLPNLRIHEPLIPREVMIPLGLDRMELEEEIQRYQFMRLISAAKEVHLVYQQSKDKDKSRFVEELIWEEERKQNKIGCLKPTQPSFHVKINATKREIKKTDAMVDALRAHTFSASSLNLYLRNPLEFYYNYVLGLREKDDLLDEPENRQVGTFIHHVLEEAFRPFEGKKPKVDQEFRKYFLSLLDERFSQTLAKSMRADAFLLKRVIDERMKRFLDKEAADERGVSKILYVEKTFKDKISLSCGPISFVYKLDRVDALADGTILLLDYKTGSVDPMPKQIEQIEAMPLSRENVFEKIKSFQIPLYFFYLEQYFKDDAVNAGFYNLRTLEINRFIDSRMRFDRQRIRAAFFRALDFILTEILDPDKPFIEP